ncbi:MULTISPECIES: GEVED domain-containing protein [unclassified Photobacterium]|uniref:GEVED domain-containing protein n=1 Tax=unclassified Photobacterium TaxID=2628852 RepID=UPI001EDCEB7D|nr:MULTISPECIES: GEVED domain-containing protein [unclassified Photobacterium]MCG3865785.1 hypothetical protein [Photobacterium sp. Ph6]MCG3877260.1 hypothetical protein [Photobacterium sp. Ph5]
MPKIMLTKIKLTTIVFLGYLFLYIVPPVYAAEGVGLVYQSTLLDIGGNGGGEFGERMCPSGQLMTGFDFYNQNTGGNLDGTALRGQCSQVSVVGNVATLTAAGTTPWGGPTTGTLYSGDCPANQAVVGVQASTTTHPVMGWFKLYCAPVIFNSGTNRLEIGPAPATPSTGIIGPNRNYPGTFYNRVVAPSGQAVAGFNGRSGAALDKVRFRAYSFVQASMTLNAVVENGSALASDFDLIATDSAAIAVTFSSGETKPMTPSSYTFTWTGSSDYELVSFSCANPLSVTNGNSYNCTYTFRLIAIDYGDAPDSAAGTGNNNYNTTKSDNGARHHEYNFDNDSQVDITLGTVWDTDDGTLHNISATKDDTTDAPNDEDGVSYNTDMRPGSNQNITITATLDPGSNLSNVNLYAWIDWNQNGRWDDPGELIINVPAVTTNTAVSHPITVPTTATLGYTYMRVRVCSNTDCNAPLGEVMDGEVEDYRIFISDLNLNNTCDKLYVTESNDDGNNFTYSSVEPDQPFTFMFDPIKTNVNYRLMNGLAFDRMTGKMYSTYVDGSHIALVVTDTSGTSFIPLGYIYADGNYSIDSTDGGGPVVLNEGDRLPENIGGEFTANMGTISRDGSTYYIAMNRWDSLISIDLAAMTYSVKKLPLEIIGTNPNGIRIGSDWAVSEHDGLIYSVDLTGNGFIDASSIEGAKTEPTSPVLYGYNPTTDSIITIPLNFNGAKAPNIWTGAVATDDLNHFYAFTIGGDHDTNGNGDYDLFNKVGMYRINTLNGDASFVIPSDYTRVDFHDAAGCISSIDKGDAPSSYGKVGHRNEDVDGSGTPDLILGTVWDPDLYYFYSDDATGDNTTGEDDEDGVAIPVPADIIVATSTTLPITVTGNSGFLNIFVDLNGDGDFNDTGELVLDDYSVVNGINNVPITLNAAYTEGYNGDSFIRFRLCDAADNCDSPIGTVANGEVEDYMFNLINQIILNGTVFEDNGKGVAIAHDGTQEGEERGLANFIVKAIYDDSAITGYVPNQLIQQTITSGDGSYSFTIPVELANKQIKLQVISQAAWVNISEVDITDASLNLVGKVVNSSITDSILLVTPTAGDILNHLDFGKVTVPTLEPDNYTEGELGVPVFFSHKFQVNTSGNVSFDVTDIADVPSGYPWSHMIYSDPNCDEELAASDSLIINPTSVSANTTTEVCVIIKIMVPNNVPLHTMYRYQLNATMDFASSTLSQTISNTDTLIVSFKGAGELEITKTVKNITQNDTEKRRNEAQPGDILEYKIFFINNGLGNINSITLFDVVPEYTKLDAPILCSFPEVNRPTSLTGCNVTTLNGDNIVGYEGGVQWMLSGNLIPAESGYVTYRVKIK